MKRTVTILAILSVLATWSLLPRTSAFAATLTPPPPGNDYVCQTNSNGTFCHGSLTLTATNMDTGISCGTFEVLTSYTVREHYEAYYNQAGLAIHGKFHGNGPGVFINSVTGKTITSNGSYTLSQQLAVPGDLNSATSTYTGAYNVSTAPGIGLVTHDVGKIVVDPLGNIVFQSGGHPLFTGDPAAIQAICSALA